MIIIIYIYIYICVCVCVCVCWLILYVISCWTILCRSNFSNYGLFQIIFYTRLVFIILLNRWTVYYHKHICLTRRWDSDKYYKFKSQDKCLLREQYNEGVNAHSLKHAVITRALFFFGDELQEISLVSDLQNTHTHTQTQIHTHTHTHIYIYIYISINNQTF